MQKKKIYVAPTIEVIGLENEGVIAASGSTSEGYTPTPLPTSGAYSNTATSSDLDEMINDIFTVQ